MSYAALRGAVETLAARYRRMGVRRRDRIVCQLPNCPEHLVAAFAAWECGAIHVGVHHQYTGRELSSVVGLTHPSLVVYQNHTDDAGQPSAIEQVRTDHPETHMFPVSEWDTTTDSRTPEAMASASPADPAAIFLTSGSTGVPKMPLGFQGRLAASWSGLSAQLGFSPSDVHLGHLPLAHGFGLMLATAGLLGGGKLILLERFSRDEVLDVITRKRVTVLHGSATHFQVILDRLDPALHDVSSLRIGVASASAFPPPLLRQIRADLGMDLLVMYGSSEGVGVATRDPDDYLQGSVGRPEPRSVTIVGPDHAALPTGAAGEIAFSREFFPVRYWKGTGDAASDVEIEEVSTGWYYSGDLGRIDEDGRLFVLGRLKHQINRGGSKIDPTEVENALLAYPGVIEAAVIGVPHPVLGEKVCAYVVTADGCTVTLDGVRDTLRRTLAPFKLPEELHLRDQLPRTPLGKVDVERLRSEAGAVVEAVR
jgi:acyl-CoA synthetase (AMP-forming)/AMP-acid ligase II